ncbi:hypothetical protein RRG08_060149 [Elysia crispata]|uniref:Uncharacterized protein n=1 Tax=Elysia crispata TaxID=231223 RepID=A0AAE0ZZQ1_9GAST|nr:hypothetical protein RRG08_060149 [Elysia crispata]
MPTSLYDPALLTLNQGETRKSSTTSRPTVPGSGVDLYPSLPRIATVPPNVRLCECSPTNAVCGHSRPVASHPQLFCRITVRNIMKAPL